MKKIRDLVITLAVTMMTAVVGAQTPEAPQTTDQGSAVEAVLGNFPSRPSLHAPSVRTKPINMVIRVHVGPLKDSPNYPSFLSDIVNKGNKYPEVFTLKPEDVSAPVPGIQGLPEGKTLWFTIELTSEEPFIPGGFLFSLLSDPSTIFNKIETYYDSNTLMFVYSSSSRGVVWGENGVRTYIDQGPWSSRAVNQFTFVGSASKTMDYTSLAQFESNKKWMLGFSNFSITGIWTMYDSGGKELVTGLKTLETKPKVVVPVELKIERISSTKLRLTTPQFSGRSVVYGRRSLATNTNPSVVGTIPGNSDGLSVERGDGNYFFYALAE